MRRLASALAVILVAGHLIATGAAAQASQNPIEFRTETPSGFPVPRFVSFKHDDTNCRLGPTFEHPILVTYLKAGTPVMVVAETTDHWRKIRDADGVECWAHQSTLKAPTHALVLEEVALYARPDSTAAVRARLGQRVLARIERVDEDWVKLSASGLFGWADARRLWGVSGHAAPHN